MTGFFGPVQGELGRATKVHIVTDDERPICGAHIGPSLQFAWSAMGIHWPYVECENCKRIDRAKANQPT